MHNFMTRRDALRLVMAGTASLALAAKAAAQIPRQEIAAPKLPIEKNASLRVLRPARFIEPDEILFRANTAKFQQSRGVETRVDFIGWEDIRQQSAVAANVGAGPDIVIGWAEDPHVYADKIIEVTDRRGVSRQALWRLGIPRREIRQERQNQRLASYSV